MTPNEVREKSDADLAKTVGELEQELFTLRFRLGAGQLKQTANIRKVRRDLARVKTVQVQRSRTQAS